MHLVVPSEARALSLISVVAGALGVLALAALFRRFDRDPASADWALGGLLLAVACPLYWMTAARPLSDSAGLAATVAVQALTLAASSPGALAAAAGLAALAAGIRSQVVWLTVPLLLLAIVRRPGNERWRAALVSAGAYAAGALLWVVPLVALTGGPLAYWRALSEQGAEDLSGVRMLWTTPTAREFVLALYYAFAAPWGLWSVAVVVLVFAALGAALMFRYARPALALVALAFGPYLIFDLLFQETVTTRYALPLVVPVAYLACRGAFAFGRRAGFVATIALAMFGAHIGGTSIAAYSRSRAPAFRMLDDMEAAARTAAVPPVLAMDRRENLDLRRPMAWAGGAGPFVAARLPAPPEREWLELVKYWNSGGDHPVWFVADPLRTDIDLVAHPDAIEYRWTLPYPILIGGVRPNEMAWYRIDRPEWYVGEGWALTPEAAGVAEADRRGPSLGGIDGWLGRQVFGGTLVVGGRNLAPSGPPARVRVQLEGAPAPLADIAVPPGPFLRLIDLPPAPPVPSRYVKVSVAAASGSRVAVEQFDASSPSRPVVFGYAGGWQEAEYNPATGARWRWLSERGRLEYRGSGANGIVLHLEGESPRTYFSKASRLVVRAGATVVFDDELSSDFSIDITIPPAIARRPFGGSITLETDQVFVPAERSRRSADRRHLGLRIFRCALRPAS